MYKKKDKYILDFSNVRYYAEVHEIIARELDFPDYYGGNWDAFWDCITDLYGEELHIEIKGLENVQAKFKGEGDTLIKILKDFKHNYNNAFSDKIKIEVFYGKTKIELS